jgi:acyl dehydratase
MNDAFPNFRTLDVGATMSGRLTVTEAHIVLASGIFADFAPLHTDEEFAQQTRYGTRIAHGTLIAGIMAGVLSKSLGTNALGYLEQCTHFLAPVVAGDTVATTWTVTALVDKPSLDGGIVTLAGSCSTQKGTVVVTADSSLIVAYGEDGP